MVRSLNGMARSVRGSFGRPRTRSPTMPRWISSVPPAMDRLGLDSDWYWISPYWVSAWGGELSELSRPLAPSVDRPVSRAVRASAERDSLVSEPAPLGRRPAATLCPPRTRRLSMFSSAHRPARRCRSTGSLFLAVLLAASMTTSLGLRLGPSSDPARSVEPAGWAPHALF